MFGQSRSIDQGVVHIVKDAIQVLENICQYPVKYLRSW
jgi:hypothetical protein